MVGSKVAIWYNLAILLPLSIFVVMHKLGARSVIRPTARGHVGSFRRTLHVHLTRGDLATAECDALVTSANDALVGNQSPTYWRFISRVNIDGAIRKLAGPQLEEACLAMPARDPASIAPGVRRDITRWTSQVKRGTSAILRCPAGECVSTPAFGDVRASHIIHAVAPDSEFGYEGQYTGGNRDAELSGVQGKRRYASDLPQFTPPDEVLLSTYVSVMSEAERLGAENVVCPALGTGVKGWKPAISAAFGLEAAARHVAASGAGGAAGAGGAGGGAAAEDGAPKLDGAASAMRELTFVIGGTKNWADPIWKVWVRTARSLLGPPLGVSEGDDPMAKASAAGAKLTWDLSPFVVGSSAERRLGANTAAAAAAAAGGGGRGGGGGGGGHVLELGVLPEFEEMYRNRARGYSGMEEALTPEQEIAAQKRRVVGPGG